MTVLEPQPTSVTDARRAGAAAGAPTGSAAPAAPADRSVQVSTAVYEGPFDLLLHLILNDRVDLYEVRLADIVDAYLAELERMRRQSTSLDLELATEFLLIAATLIELKTRRLLPQPEGVDLDEELALWEERDLLLARLLECKTFKDAGQVLARLVDDAGRSFPRVVGPEEPFRSMQPDLLEGIRPQQLAAAFAKASTPKPIPVLDLFHVTPIRVTVADAVEELLDELPRAGILSFRHLTAAFVDRIEVIVRFLAVLELFKQGYVELDQPDTFGELTITWIGENDEGGLPLGSSVVRRPLRDAIDVYEG
jgi:segregation and condensation protein A